jgi:hypothetical protein
VLRNGMGCDAMQCDNGVAHAIRRGRKKMKGPKIQMEEKDTKERRWGEGKSSVEETTRRMCPWLRPSRGVRSEDSTGQAKLK